MIVFGVSIWRQFFLTCGLKLGIVRYMRIVAYTAVQGVYVFVFIGVLRTIFDIAVAELQKKMELHPRKPPKTKECPLKRGPFQKERIVFQSLRHVSFRWE